MKTRSTQIRWLTCFVALLLCAMPGRSQQGPGSVFGRGNRGNSNAGGQGGSPGSGLGAAAANAVGAPGAGNAAGSAPTPGGGEATDDGSGSTPNGILGGVISTASSALGQLTGSGSSGGSSASSTSTQSNSIESSTLIQVINKAFNTDSDIVNPENNTITYKGQTMDPTQTREFRSRFERYLALAPAPDMLAYQDVLNQISDLLSTKTAGNVESRMKQAWTLLYQAGEYKADGGVSLGVANQVFNTWRLRDDNTAQQIAYAELQRAKTLQQRTLAYVTNTSVAESTGAASASLTSAANTLASSGLANPAGLASASSLTGAAQSGTTSSAQQPAQPAPQQNQPNRRGAAAGSDSTPTSSLQGTVGAGSLAYDAEQLGETVGKIGALQANTLLTAQQAKLQMQLQIVELFLGRRYQHALIASSFYRFLFKGDQQSIDPKFKKDLGTVFGANNPTSSALGDMPFTRFFRLFSGLGCGNGNRLER